MLRHLQVPSTTSTGSTGSTSGSSSLFSLASSSFEKQRNSSVLGIIDDDKLDKGELLKGLKYQVRIWRVIALVLLFGCIGSWMFIFPFDSIREAYRISNERRIIESSFNEQAELHLPVFVRRSSSLINKGDCSTSIVKVPVNNALIDATEKNSFVMNMKLSNTKDFFGNEKRAKDLLGLNEIPMPKEANNFIFWDRYLGGAEHFPVVFEILKDRTCPVVVDVGVNVGGITLFSLAQGAKVYGYEALPLNHAIVDYLIRINGFSLRGQVMNAAASDVAGKSVYVDMNNRQGNSNLMDGQIVEDANGRTGSRVVQVNTRVISDDLLRVCENPNGILLVKIDVEGSEELVRRGLDKLLDKKCIEYILTEYAPDNLSDTSKLNDPSDYLIAFMKKGYKVYHESCSNPGTFSPEAKGIIPELENDIGVKCGKGEHLVRSIRMKDSTISEFEITLEKVRPFTNALRKAGGTLTNLLIVRNN